VGYKAILAADTNFGSSAKALASGSYTFWWGQAAGIGASNESAPTTSVQACLSACDRDHRCAAVAMTGVTAVGAPITSCSLIRGDSTLATFKRSVTRVVPNRLGLTVAASDSFVPPPLDSFVPPNSFFKGETICPYLRLVHAAYQAAVEASLAEKQHTATASVQACSCKQCSKHAASMQSFCSGDTVAHVSVYLFRPKSSRGYTAAHWLSLLCCCTTGLVVNLAVGHVHACAITPVGSPNGTLTCWGAQSMDAWVQSMAQNQAVVPASPTAWSAVAAGLFQTCGIDAYGLMHCWGKYGWSWAGNYPPATVPNDVAAAQWSAVDAGYYHTCGILEGSGRLRCFGTNGYGQSTVPVNHTASAWSAVSAGAYVTCGILADAKELRCWGGGDGWAMVANIPTASPAYRWDSVSVGWNHACGILADTGILQCWGDEYAIAEMGLPVGTASARWRHVSAGFGITCGILESDGTLRCWGADNLMDYARVPADLTNEAWDTVSASTLYVCGILAGSGQVRCWGDNSYGQIDVPAGL
jgi:hypothetical protein